MEQISVTSTIEKIQGLIEDNSGDIGRLEHISDFLKKNKPLYNTDKKYLEKKINSKIIIVEKKKIIKKESESEQIKKLIESGKGDPGRLEHIQTMLKKQKKLYESDKQYLENNFKIKIIEKQKGKVKIEKIENEINQLEIQNDLWLNDNVWEDWFDSFKLYFNKIGSYKSFEDKRKFITDHIEKIVVSWNKDSNTHNIQIQFKLNIVKDKGDDMGKGVYKIKKGKNVVKINDINILKTQNKLSKNNKSKTLFIDYSTVTDFARFLG